MYTVYFVLYFTTTAALEGTLYFILYISLCTAAPDPGRHGAGGHLRIAPLQGGRGDTFTLYTLHFTLYTLYFIFYTLHFMFYKVAEGYLGVPFLVARFWTGT